MDQVDQYAFHRLGRSWPHYRWWKPLVTGLLGTAIYIAFTIVLLVIAVVIALATSADVERYIDPAAVIDLSDPVIFAFTLASLIIMIPALVLATLVMGPKPIGLLSSVVGRLRWRWLGLCTLVAVGIYAASLAISTVLGALFPTEAPPIAQPDTSTMLILLALTLLAVPFQAAAEEYVFRGYLMQLVGGWLKHPAFAILLPVPLFVVGHLYDPLGLIDVAIFAIFAGWITWRTGGLEAAIAVHAINNMTIFALGAFGLVDVNASEGSVSGLVVSVVTMGITAFILVKLADRQGIERTRAVAAAPAPEAQGWPGTTSFPTGDGVWHESRQPRQLSTTGQFGGWAAPGQAAPVPDQSHRYDKAQYEPRQYGGAPQDTAAGGAPSTSAPYDSNPLRLPDPASPSSRAAAPAPYIDAQNSAPQTAPSASRFGSPSQSSTPRQPAGTGYPGGQGYPAGTGYPAGQGYPAGTSFPAGPGYPAARQPEASIADAAPSGEHEGLQRHRPGGEQPAD